MIAPRPEPLFLGLDFDETALAAFILEKAGGATRIAMSYGVIRRYLEVCATNRRYTVPEAPHGLWARLRAAVLRLLRRDRARDSATLIFTAGPKLALEVDYDLSPGFVRFEKS